jgi:hypothetical protein
MASLARLTHYFVISVMMMPQRLYQILFKVEIQIKLKNGGGC